MNSNKVNSDSNIKGKFYQIKTLSEKNIPNKEITKSLQLTKLVEMGQVQNLRNFLEKDCPSPQMLNEAIISLLKTYNEKNQNFYEILRLLLLYGANVNLHIIFPGKTPRKNEEKVTLLMFGIMKNDVDLVNLILSFNPDIEQTDHLGRNAIILSVIFEKNDSPEILNLLIKKKANINFALNLQMSKSPNHIEYHSVLTLACFEDLTNIVKCLLENNADVNFKTQPNEDTCLHIAVKYGSPKLVELLLSYPTINSEITNISGKRAVDLIKDDEKGKIMKNIFNNYYKSMNIHNMIINNQSQNQGGNFSGNNMNIGNYSGIINNNNGNNALPQMTQLNQMQQIHQMKQMAQMNLNMNNGKRPSVNNSPNVGINYFPPGINMRMQSNSLKNNMNFNLNNLGNNNIQNNNMIKDFIYKEDIKDSSDESIEDEKDNNKESLNQNSNFNYMNNQTKNNTNNKLYNNQIINNMNNNINNNFNKQTNRNLIMNTELSSSQLYKSVSNFNNINQNINHINPFELNLLKQNLSNRILNTPKINYNIEIPVEFQKNGNNENQKINVSNNIGNFINKNNIPIINLDLTNKSLLELELKHMELNEKLKEKDRLLSEIQNEYNKKEEEIKQLLNLLEEKKNDLNNFSFLNEQDEAKLIELNSIKKNLIEQIPQDKLCQKSYKYIDYPQYIKLKFDPPCFEPSFIHKTLHKDLIDYEKYIDYLIYKKKPNIEIIFNKIKLIIGEIAPEYEVKIYGSYAHGLSLPWSDLNLILVSNNKNNRNIKEDNITDFETTVGEKSIESGVQSQNDNNSATHELNINSENNNKEEANLIFKLYNIFSKINWANDPKILNMNQAEEVNILSFTTTLQYGKIEINISLENDNNKGLKVVELVKSYIKEYSCLKPLIFALGTILKNANLNIASSGGLSSYGLILMVVSFIQSQKDNNNSTDDEYNIGRTFYEFLLHYGIKFDFNKYVIITYKINETNSSLNDKENAINIGQNAKELMIVDPLNNKNNVAKSTFQFMNLKMAFMIAFMVTKEDCECGCHFGKAFYENNFNSTEHSYLKRMFNSVKRFTETGK